MAGASAEGEVNHWPAFVDVLTTVIMVVTFLLVIMSAAVMVLSQRTLQTVKAQLEAKEHKTADPSAATSASAKDQNSRPTTIRSRPKRAARMQSLARCCEPISRSTAARR
ncbi:hypothetical protein C1T17_19690 [Sphingobium sp. SCG-1]|uniref:hypothetical protein n=1 Tax=Sphingobium sp. SCG-1 TaxID=2072936 RepID=UPI000CD6831C|nr:hypothetical protein [Sphingobium sp. SCG-1]AUW59963.1 hypothetical protein C1T17_19690 [Sphingobium sp. SCG-1]